MSTYHPTYLPTYRPTVLPVYLSTYLSTYCVARGVLDDSRGIVRGIARRFASPGVVSRRDGDPLPRPGSPKEPRKRTADAAPRCFLDRNGEWLRACTFQHALRSRDARYARGSIQARYACCSRARATAMRECICDYA